jgi:acyl-CoA dehydrogenase
MNQIQHAFYGVFENFPSRVTGALLRIAVFPWGKSFSAPPDYLGRQIGKLLLEASPTRDRLTSNVFVLRHEDDPVGRLELAMQEAAAGEATEAKIRNAVKAGVIAGLTEPARIAAAIEKGLISTAEAVQFQHFSALRRACVMVDDFPQDLGRPQAAREQPASLTALSNAISQKTAA